MKISLVIFDMDGLMFDTEKIAVWAWQKAGQYFGIEIDPCIVIETVGCDIKGTEKLFKQYLGDDFPFSEVRKKRIEFALLHIEHNGLPVKDGLYELLEWLSKKGFPKAVATSSERSTVVRYLDMANIIDAFDVIVCGDELCKGKPDPEIFLKAASKSGCDPSKCLVLEDSGIGILAASRAGMLPVLIPDMKMPSEEIRKLAFNELRSLSEVISFMEDYI